MRFRALLLKVLEDLSSGRTQIGQADESGRSGGKVIEEMEKG